MSPIYLRDGDDFVAMSQQPYRAEEVLQVLLAEHPEVLAGTDDSSAWLLVKREAGIADSEAASDRWSLDHLFLDASGIPTLVEAKRSSDPRARREVVAQMLDYAANSTAFWGVERLQAWFETECEKRGTDGASALRAAFGITDPDLYWAQVQTNLAAARIRLVFVADEISAELASIVEYLNRQMRETEVIAIEVKQYVDGGNTRQTVVPRVVGRTEAARVAKGAQGRSTTVLDLSAASPAFHDLIAHMNEVADDLGLAARPARSGRNYQPSITEAGAQFVAGVGVYASDRGAEFNLQVFRDLGRDDLADEIIDRIFDVTGRKVSAKAWPSVPCEVLVENWARVRAELIEPYFAARALLARQSSGT